MLKKIQAMVLGLALLCTGGSHLFGSEYSRVVASNFIFVKCGNCGAITGPGGPCHVCKK